MYTLHVYVQKKLKTGRMVCIMRLNAFVCNVLAFMVTGINTVV